MGIKKRKSFKLVTVIGLTTSILIAGATLGVAFYSLFFINKVLGPLALQDDFYARLLVFKHGLCRWVFASLLLGSLVSYYLTKIIINPLMDFINGTRQLSKGNLSYRFKDSGYKEIGELISTYNQMAENLQLVYFDLEAKVNERTKALENANDEIKNAQAMVLHSEKMRSLGQLVAGITHEINNPINFIYGNMVHLKNYSNVLFDIISAYEAVENDLSNEKQMEIKQLKEKLELGFIKEDLPLLIKSCYEGTERTKNIILDLKNFSRLDEFVISDIDVVKEINTTLNILHNKIKGKIEIIQEYEDNIPLVESYGGQLNQVFMNILDNACYSIKNSGTIYIRLKKMKNDVIIEFEDTGCGMKKEQIAKIFDPFYTTKPVGEGSGLGMSIGYKVIQNHNGKINIESVEGKGTRLRIQLPVTMKKNIEFENGKI